MFTAPRGKQGGTSKQSNSWLFSWIDFWISTLDTFNMKMWCFLRMFNLRFTILSFFFWRIFLNFKLKGLLEKCELVPEKQCHNRAIRVDPPLQQFHDQHFVGATPPRGSWRRRRVRWFEGEDGFAQSEHSDGTSGLADLSKDRMDN